MPRTSKCSWCGERYYVNKVVSHRNECNASRPAVTPRKKHSTCKNCGAKYLRGQHYKHVCQLALTTPSPVPSQIYSDVAMSRLLEQCHLGAFNDQVMRHSSIHLYKFHCKPLRVSVYPCIGVHSYRVARCLVWQAHVLDVRRATRSSIWGSLSVIAWSAWMESVVGLSTITIVQHSAICYYLTSTTIYLFIIIMYA